MRNIVLGTFFSSDLLGALKAIGWTVGKLPLLLSHMMRARLTFRIESSCSEKKRLMDG